MPRIALTEQQKRAHRKSSDLESIRIAIACGLVRQHMTKPELAELLGVSAQTVRRWCNDPESLSVGRLAEIVALLKLDWRAFDGD